ncbi:MAG: class I SAM-dependent methyltransferase [Candidatus Competibacteraceae bacterium]|nr:class I SAM-dependent methyltransferase [Candidatus Competibacteraceae bacterium]
MTEDDFDPKEHWNRRYAQGEERQEPARVLVENLHLLPREGNALDIACGLGASSMVLARRGLKTWAWDISTVAIRRLEDAAWEDNLEIQAEVRDVTLTPPDGERFEVILVHRFLERELAAPIINALKPGGLLLYQTFVRDKANPQAGPKTEDFLLEEGELLKLFAPLRIRVYREEGRLGDLEEGFRNEAMLIGQKTAKKKEE